MQVFYTAYCSDSLCIVRLVIRSAAGLDNLMLVGRKSQCNAGKYSIGTSKLAHIIATKIPIFVLISHIDNLYIRQVISRNRMTSQLRFLKMCKSNTFSCSIFNQIKAKEVGGTCCTDGRGEETLEGFGGKARMSEITWKTKT